MTENELALPPVLSSVCSVKLFVQISFLFIKIRRGGASWFSCANGIIIKRTAE